MGRIFLSRHQATHYKPQVGETLREIVGKCPRANPPISKEELAQFNWGTKEAVEVLRALVELVGCRKVNELDPYLCELDPSKGLTGRILLPKLWSRTDLAYEKVHTLKVRRPLPATAISISSLDPWFLPGEENCGIVYQLEGVEERAHLLDIAVYASNYCKATAKVQGDFVDYTYTGTPDVPIVERSVSTEAPERQNGEIQDWKGESEAASGVLAKRAGTTRYINVASSPYTVVLRYSKTAAKNAFVNLHSFWPCWTGTGDSRSVVADSLKIKWTARHLPAGLLGQIQIFDKDGIVWRRALPPAKTGNGEQQFDWSAEGKGIVEEGRMPYRVQLQLHTDRDTDDGFAIAATHTEVRLYTDEKIGTYGDDHEQERQALEFSLAPYYAGPKPPEDSAKGRKLRLANAGYHPGPVADEENQPDYLRAVKEFQRDHTKPGSSERLKCDGHLDPDTEDAIAALAPGRRPLFATSDDSKSNLTDPPDIRDALNDRKTETTVWVDDRHNYTRAVPQKLESSSDPYLLPNMKMENYRGTMSGEEIKQAKDSESICRPWIPLQVSPAILRKGDSLMGSELPPITPASCAAVGPIRIDWTFRDLAFETLTDDIPYQPTRARPKRYLTDTFQAIKGPHNGKDAWNCTVALGGIRGKHYHQAPFGYESDGLMPWKAMDDSDRKAVCSVTHDDLGQDENHLFQSCLGKAGVYLHPSNIAGDGYQLRAQVSFRDLPEGATHPNWKVLRDRYDATKLPQAHSAPLRLWRKDTLRAHILWSPEKLSAWKNAVQEVPRLYKPAMVHFEFEGGALTDIAPVTSLLNEDEYLKLVRSAFDGDMGPVVKMEPFAPQSSMKFSKDYVWPWPDVKHLGIQAVPKEGVGMGDYESPFLKKTIADDSWSSFADPLLHLLLARVESKKALLRGHLFAEFCSSPAYFKEAYICDRCHRIQILLETSEHGGSGVGEDCRSSSCSGKLKGTPCEDYRCDVCGHLRKKTPLELHLEGTACDQKCDGTLVQVPDGGQLGQTVYRCDKCGRTTTVQESTDDLGMLDSTVCGQPCRGHLHGDSSTRKQKTIARGAYDSLPWDAIGQSLGCLWIFSRDTPDSSGQYATWAHEIGHHKQMQHAGNGGGAVRSQHDSEPNLVDEDLRHDLDAGKIQANEANWDRVCVMSYHNKDSGPDTACFCGKCILKLRGWMVEGDPDSGTPATAESGQNLTNPDGKVRGP